MDLEETITNLIHLPRRQNERGNSTYSLLKESGYLENYAAVSEDLIQEALSRNPGCVREWMQFSEDKRSDGWHLVRESEKSFDLAYIPSKGETCSIQAVQYCDETTACAAFIKLEIEGMRLRHPT